jgi:hypothetical protein
VRLLRRGAMLNALSAIIVVVVIPAGCLAIVVAILAS